MEISLEQAADLLKEKSSFVLTAHVNPDGDAVGSLLAMALMLRTMGKKVVCQIDDNLPGNFRFLSGFETIGRPSGTEGRLDADLLVILDASDRRRVGAVGDLCVAPVLNFDHHISNKGFADYCCLDSRAAATGEMIFQLAELLQIDMTVQLAECLYTAIATDCGFFRYSNTTPRTLRIGAALLESGVSPNKISEAAEEQPLSSVKALGRALVDALEFFAAGKIGCMALDCEFLAQCDSTESFIDVVRTIEGLDVAILVKEVERGICRVSMRSKTLDVSAIALQFGGGGHRKAAGCTVKNHLAAVKEAVVNAVACNLEGAHG